VPGPEAWQAFAGVGTVIVFLGGVVYALRRLGIIGGPAAAPAPAPKPETSCIDADVLARLRQVEQDLAAFRLHVAENFIHRNDYIPNESRVIALLEKHSVMLARLDERTGAAR